jgi:hypothetical protein
MSIAEHLGRQVAKHKEKHKKEEPPAHKHGHAEEVRIKKADNGYHVESHHEQSQLVPSEAGGWEGPELTVFGHKDHKKMMKHVSECLGCGSGDTEEPE